MLCISYITNKYLDLTNYRLIGMNAQ